MHAQGALERRPKLVLPAARGGVFRIDLLDSSERGGSVVVRTARAGFGLHGL